MPKLKLNITRRWIKARPGSVLILVIALLVLLALIGTAYLSSTQTERYSSVQNSVNTEADLLMQGLQVSVNSAIAGGLYSTGQVYRAPQQEQPTYPVTVPTPVPAVPLNGYFPYDSTSIDQATLSASDPHPPDLFLSDRIPTMPGSTGVPTWNTISWPLYPDSTGSYTFDSPFENSVSTFIALNKANILAIPTYKQLNGQIYPGMIYYIPVATGQLGVFHIDSNPVDDQPINPPGAYLVPNTPVGQYFYQMSLTDPTPGLITAAPLTAGYPAFINFAASASGDGIADSGLFKMPIGQVNGVTYYGAIRVVDGNSALNVSSAYEQTGDTGYGGNPTINYGFFRSNIGLFELLVNAGDLSNLNALRGISSSGGVATPSPANSFNWYSYLDQVDHQLVNQPGTPQGGFNWLGQSVTATLAYKYSLFNPNLNESNAEIALEYELHKNLPSTPWSPSQVYSSVVGANSWWSANFAGLNSYSGAGPNTSPLRTVLVGNNAVSNAIAPRYGNSGSSGPPAWAMNTAYNFGDWVTDGGAGLPQRSFVCIQQHNSLLGANEPELTPTSGVGYNPAALGYWAGAQSSAAVAAPLPGMPFSSVPVKTSINTATFEQLWLGFAHVMTDSISLDPGTTVVGATVQWQPPMQPVTATAVNGVTEQQMGMFRSTLRSSVSPRPLLTSSQMLKLRAAIAAVNTMDLRDSDDDVTSRELVLTDAAGTPKYDVEVYGTERQPYISEVVLQSDGTAAKTYIALELCNPYQTQMDISNWQIASINRSATGLTYTVQGNGSTTVTIPPGTIIPAATPDGTPGLLIMEDNLANRPTDLTTQINTNLALHPTTDSQTVVEVPGMGGAAIYGGQPNELFIMRPRLASNVPSSNPATGTNDVYNESANPYDLVPVDQLDFTGLTFTPAAGGGGGGGPPNPVRYTYRRGNDGTTLSNRAWHCVYPGFYDAAGTNGRYYTNSSESASAFGPPDSTDTEVVYLGLPKGGTSAPSTYTTVPIELNNAHAAGPLPLSGANNTFPFGQFSRNGDMLQIPFIGAYRIRPYTAKGTTGVIGNVITELNSVTIDSALANDNSPTPDDLTTGYANPDGDNTVPPTRPSVFKEQIGRFCPVGDPSAMTAGTPPKPDASKQLDFGPGFAAGDTSRKMIYWHYHWAKRIFDYFTVQAPSDDYYPNVNPIQSASVTILPTPVANSNSSYANAQTAGHSEDTTGVEGLININTAPMAVLAQIPFTGTATTPSAAQNAAIAAGIVKYRTQYGPFQSIFDLYRVPEFLKQNNTPLATAAAGPLQGLFCPYGLPNTLPAPPNPVTGTTRYDFQERFLLLNNISNLITTRSDTFTCYLLLQGWRNVGTGNPTLVVQRRLAFLADRTAVTPSSNTVANYKAPGD